MVVYERYIDWLIPCRLHIMCDREGRVMGWKKIEEEQERKRTGKSCAEKLCKVLIVTLSAVNRLLVID